MIATVFIPIYRGDDVVAYATIDETDYAWAASYTWRLSSSGYAVTRIDDQQTLMHRALLGLVKGDGVVVDHANHRPLDNRRVNLRCGTHAENFQNTRNHGPLRGVRRRPSGRFYAEARLNGRNHHLGSFATSEEAARAAANFRRAHMPFSPDANQESTAHLRDEERSRLPMKGA